MSRKSKKRKAQGLAFLFILIIGILIVGVGMLVQLVSDYKTESTVIVIVILVIVLVALITEKYVKRQQKLLMDEILEKLGLVNIGPNIAEFDDRITVKSKQTLNNYTDIKYLKDKDNFESIREKNEHRKLIRISIERFLEDNEYEERLYYGYVEEQLKKIVFLTDGYRVQVSYITSAGNLRGRRIIHIDSNRIDYIASHPECLMSKGELNKLYKQKAKEELEEKKHAFYDLVNQVIDYANESKDELIVKSETKKIDDLVQRLFDGTVNSIQKIKQLDSDEWDLIANLISNIDKEIKAIVTRDKRISEYYASDDFAKIKETCKLLSQSRKEFNDYIEEKAESISSLFGTRVVRNETQHEDTYNYIRSYKKSITPFTAEVSAAVFASAENSPIDYIVKYFYPNKSQYEEQIDKLRVLIEELETLKEAKVIIQNYKKDYEEYIQNVPGYVLKNDEDGFYYRLGLTTLDEAVLNVEYKFVYTSGGGMAQRSFTVPMNEETIIELINNLENKLTKSALAKEQRALMTTKLRNYIKERDHYTCCQC